MSTRRRIIIATLFTAITLGYVFISYRYYYGYLTQREFVMLTIATTLISVSNVFLLKNEYSRIGLPRINFGKIELIFPIIVVFNGILEMLLFGHTGLGTIFSLICGLSLLAFSNPSFSTAMKACTLIMFTSSILYMIYTPSLGNDTWRDATQALQIIERGGLNGLTINHPAYPFPVLSILYAIYSIVAGFNTLWSSSFIGLVYLVLLTLWIYIVAKHLNAEYPHISVILLLSTPLIVVWSVSFIPQTYAILAAIPLLFLELPLMLILIFGAAMVLGHGGVSLWAIILLTFLVFAKRILKVRVNVLRSIGIKFIMVALLFILYATYTTLSMVLEGSVNSIIEAITNLIAGERSIESTPPSIQRPPSSVLGVVPVIVLAVLGALVLLGHRTALIRLLAFFSLAGLGVAYIGAATPPALDLPRYVGLGSAVLLTILSSHGVEVLTRRGRLGDLYALLLILFAIVSFGFSGTLMPRNPYTANPYSTWSISGLITYDEAKILDDTGSLVCCNNYLVDLRAGAYLEYKYLWIQPRSRGFYNPETQSIFTFAGSYGLYITSEYLIKYNGVFILRKTVLNIPEAFSPDAELFLVNVVPHRTHILFNSPLINVYYFSSHS